VEESTVLSRHLHEVTEENYENLNQDVYVSAKVQLGTTRIQSRSITAWTNLITAIVLYHLSIFGAVIIPTSETTYALTVISLSIRYFTATQCSLTALTPSFFFSLVTELNWKLTWLHWKLTLISFCPALNWTGFCTARPWGPLARELRALV
jgi:hypothetical protein